MDEVKNLIEKVKNKVLARIVEEIFEEIEFDFFIHRKQENHFDEIEIGAKQFKIDLILQIIDKKEWPNDYKYLVQLYNFLGEWRNKLKHL